MATKQVSKTILLSLIFSEFSTLVVLCQAMLINTYLDVIISGHVFIESSKKIKTNVWLAHISFLLLWILINHIFFYKAIDIVLLF